MKRTRKRKTILKEIKGTADEITGQVKKLFKEGNARKVMIINKKGKVLFQSHLTAGAAGTAVVAFLSPVIAAIGFFAVVLSDMKVVVEKYSENTQKKDDYEVDAEIIEIEDEEATKEEDSNEDKTEKTVGKNNE